MSLTDRERRVSTPTLPVSPPNPPGPDFTPEPPAPKPWRGLVVAAIVLVVIGIVATISIFVYNHQTTAATTTQPTTAPSAAITSTAPSPSPSATLSARSAAVLAAEAGYKSYVRAFDEASTKSGGDRVSTELAATITGPMVKTVADQLRATAAGHYVRSGSTKVLTRTDVLSPLTDKVPTATIAGCVDQTGVTITKAGKPFAGRPQYYTQDLTMHRVGGVWKVYDTSDKLLPDGETCVDALGPTAR